MLASYPASNDPAGLGPHDPFVQTGPLLLAEQSPSDLHATHRLAVQVGFGLSHCESLVHVQVLVAWSQSAFAPPQSVFARHPTHWPTLLLPDWVSHTSPGQSELAAHVRQVCVATSQMGVLDGQSAVVTQPTQTKTAGSQTGVAPVHEEWFSASHATQVPDAVPDVSQMGVVPVQSLAMHARQVSVVGSQ